MKRICCIFILLTGCVPLPVHQELQKKLSVRNAQANNQVKELEKCEAENRELKKALKERPVQVIERPVLNKEPIKQEELEEIKKKALEDAERRFKLRMRNSK